MATAVMQVAVVQISGSCVNAADSFASTRSSNIHAVASARVVRYWNGGSCGAVSRGSRVKKLCVSRSSTEKAAYAVQEVTDEDLAKQVQPDDIRILAAVRSR